MAWVQCPPMKTFVAACILSAVGLALAAESTGAAAPGAADLERELAEIVELLPGLYVGETSDPRTGASLKLHHKIVRIDAPQFGSDLVFYHLLARDGFDSAQPFQQKIYAFDRRPDRVRNSMRSWVYLPTTPGSNLERDPQRQRSLQQSELMNFPAELCAIRWSRGDQPREFVARVRSEDCVFESAAFKQKLRPDMTYVLSPAAFGIQDILNGENGKPLFPTSGISIAPRVAASVGEVLAGSTAADWRPLDPARSLYLQLPAGRVVFELAPGFAPAHLENLRKLVAERYFDGLAVDRVQDNFVVQWGSPVPAEAAAAAAAAVASRAASPSGPAASSGAAPARRGLGSAAATVAPEFTRDWSADLGFTPLPGPDGFAPQAGFVDGFAAAGDRATNRIWLAHCYGTLAVGRDVAADSGNAAELYAVIGHAPRQLDRNVAVLGRAVAGMEWLASLPRGAGSMGFYEQPGQRVPIRSLRFGMELPPAERADLEVLRTDSATFARVVEARRNRRDEWYVQPAGHVDLCNVPIPVRARRVEARG